MKAQDQAIASDPLQASGCRTVAGDDLFAKAREDFLNGEASIVDLVRAQHARRMSAESPLPKVLTTEEVTMRLHVPAEQIRAWADAAILPSSKVQGDYQFNLAEIIDWELRHMGAIRIIPGEAGEPPRIEWKV